jgi:hypothetical protein
MEPVFVPKTEQEKALQRALLQYYLPQNHALVLSALRQAGRLDLIGNGPHCLVPPMSNRQNASTKRPERNGGNANWQPKKNPPQNAKPQKRTQKKTSRKK